MRQIRLTALLNRHLPRHAQHLLRQTRICKLRFDAGRIFCRKPPCLDFRKGRMAKQDEIAAHQVGKQRQVIPTFGQRRPIKHRCQYLKDITQSRQTAETKDLNKTTIAAIPGHSGGGYRYLITIRIRPNSMPSKSAWRAPASCHIRPLTPCRQPHWCRGGDPVGCGCANTR